MTHRREAQLTLRFLLIALALAVAGPRAAALLEFHEGREKIDVNATYGISYDSNIYAHAGSAGDFNQSLSLSTSYTRRSGLIGLNTSLSVTTARFDKYNSEDFTNPAASLSLTKSKGRLTGLASVSVKRESRSDDAVNMRLQSWNYGSSLTLRYPVNDRYYFTSGTDFSFRDYTQKTSLFNLSSIAEAIDLYYVYTSKLDFMAGYRIRSGDADGGSHTLDHSVSLGATGGILPKLTGSVSCGYQWRRQSTDYGGNYDALTTTASLAWPMTRQIAFNFQASKDFATTATDTSVDSTSFSLSTSFKPNLKLKLASHLKATHTDSVFLGTRGAGRKDENWLFETGLTFPLTKHLAGSISYGYSTNNSDIAYSHYGRHSASFNLTAHF